MQNNVNIFNNNLKADFLRQLGDVDDYSNETLQQKAQLFINQTKEDGLIDSFISVNKALEELNNLINENKDGIKSDGSKVCSNPASQTKDINATIEKLKNKYSYERCSNISSGFFCGSLSETQKRQDAINAYAENLQKALDEGIIAQLASQGYSKEEIQEIINEVFPEQKNVSYDVYQPRMGGNETLLELRAYLELLDSGNIDYSQYQENEDKINFAKSKIEANNATIGNLEKEIEQLQKEVEKEVEENLQKSKEITEKQKQEAKRITNEELRRYVNSKGEMSYEDFQKGLTKKLDALSADGSVRISQIMNNMFSASSKMNLIKDYMQKIGILSNENNKLNDEIADLEEEQCCCCVSKQQLEEKKNSIAQGCAEWQADCKAWYESNRYWTAPPNPDDYIGNRQHHDVTSGQKFEGIDNLNSALVASGTTGISDAELALARDNNVDLTARTADGNPLYTIAQGYDGQNHIYSLTYSGDGEYYSGTSIARMYGELGDLNQRGTDITPFESGALWVLPNIGYEEFPCCYIDDDCCLTFENVSYYTSSPLSFDLDGNGINTSDKKINYDIDGDGKIDRIYDSSDAVLVFDKDNDGISGKDGSECFGDNTDLDGDGKADGYKDGFEALKALAKKEGLINGTDDNELDEKDIKLLEKKYGLKIKANGYNSQATSLLDSGITQINLANTNETTTNKNFDNKGNDLMTQKGATFIMNGEERQYADLWHRKTTNIFEGAYDSSEIDKLLMQYQAEANVLQQKLDEANNSVRNDEIEVRSKIKSDSMDSQKAKGLMIKEKFEKQKEKELRELQMRLEEEKLKEEKAQKEKEK